MITGVFPSSWQDLQQKVANILLESGFTVEVEKALETARGKVEIDVYAEEEVNGRKYSIACECKHWKSNVPQSVIHGFRTVISDLGINIGYVITTSDFQSGAIDAANYTNVKLLEWNAFQSLFLKSWFAHFFVPKITKELHPLFTYIEPLYPRWCDEMSDIDQELFHDLRAKYGAFGWVMLSFSTYARMLDKNPILPTLPLRSRFFVDNEKIGRIPVEIMNEVNYLEFMVKSITYARNAITQFRVLRDKYNQTYDDER
ncbi:MAG: restriction endonuclease [Fibrobacter sp.]|nr:restriction endonuclease [Fibrobacter sp.]